MNLIRIGLADQGKFRVKENYKSVVLLEKNFNEKSAGGA